MAVTVVQDGGNTTFKFEVTGPSAVLNDMLLSWARHVYGHGYGAVYYDEEEIQKVLFEELTLAQKCAAVDARVKDVVQDEAASGDSGVATEREEMAAARAAAVERYAL